MTDPAHKIYKNVLELDLPSKEQATEIQDRLSELLNTRLYQEMDRVFSAHVFKNKVIRIPKLTLDIGQVPLGQLETEFTERVIEELKKKLAKIDLDPAITGSENFARGIETEDWKISLEYLQHFLLYGYLPWQASQHHMDLEQVFFLLADQQPAQLMMFFKHAGKKQTVLQRMAWQFPETALTRLIGLLSPAHAKVILQYVGELDEKQKTDGLVQAESQQFKKAVYEFVLTYLLQQNGLDFQARAFARSVVKQMAAHYNLAYTDLLQYLGEVLMKQEEKESRGSLLEVITMVYAEDVKPVRYEEHNLLEKNKDFFSAGMQARIRRKHLFHLIEKGYLPPGAGDLNREVFVDLLDHLIKRSPAQLVGELRLGNVKKSVDHLVNLFPLASVQGVMSLFFQHDHKWLEKTIDKISHAAGINFFQAGKKTLIENMYAGLLTWGIEKKPNRIDRNMVVKKILLQLAFDRNKDPEETLQVFSTVFPGLIKDKTAVIFEDIHLFDFIEKGVLPVASDPEDMFLLMERIIRVSPSKLAVFLGSVNTKEKIKNLVKDFPVALIEKILSGVLGQDAQWIGTFTQDFLETNRQLSILPLDRKEFQSVLYTELLLLAITQKPGKIKPPVALEKIISQLAQRSLKKQEETFFAFGRAFAALELPLSDDFKQLNIKTGPADLVQPIASAPALYKTAGLVTIALRHFLLYNKTPWWYSGKTDNKTFLDSLRSEKDWAGFIEANVRNAKFRKNLLALVGEAAWRILVDHIEVEDGIRSNDWVEIKKRLNDKHYHLLRETYLLYLFHGDNLDGFFPNEVAEMYKHYTIDRVLFRRQLVKFSQTNRGIFHSNFFSDLVVAVEQKHLLVLEKPISEEKAGKEKQETHGDFHHQAKTLPPEELQFYLGVMEYFVTHGYLPYYYKQTLSELILQFEKFRVNVTNSGVQSWLLIGLKNDTSRKRLLQALMQVGRVDNFMQVFFSRDHRFTGKYLYDLTKVFKHETFASRYRITEEKLQEDTLMFYAAFYNRSYTAMDYTKFMMGRIFDRMEKQKEFTRELLVLVKQNQVRIKTVLPSLLQAADIRHDEPGKKQREEKEKAKKEEEEMKLPEEKTVFVENAGMVILWPFLVHYFSELKLLDEQKQFVDKTAMHRAVHLLQYLVTGVEENQPEYTLVLNKILCGMDQVQTTTGHIVLTEHEKTLSESLLKAVIQNWTIVQNTSIDGLRGTFLLRDGKIELLEDKYILTVQNKTLDILVDKISWNLSLVKLPWMKMPLHIRWRNAQ